MIDFDLIIVGGGPSGLTVGAEVARTGGRVLILEKRAVDPIPRSGTVMPRPLELFDARGIADRFIKRTADVIPHPFQAFHVWAGMAPVHWSGRESRFGFTLTLSQHDSENILRDWANECGVEILFQAEVLAVENRAENVSVTWRDADGAEQVTTSRFLVGADGGRSITREQAGISFDGHGNTFTGTIATVKMDFPWKGSLRAFQTERGWITTYPFGTGLTRFTMVHVDRRNAPVDEPVTIEEVRKCVTDIVGEELPIGDLVSGSRYGDAQRAADRFREGRIFLVGESVRVHYPASGVGMNFCIQDAFNLGWKLAAVIKGTAGESLLDTYEFERRPILDGLLASVNTQVSTQFNFSPEGLAFMDHFKKNLIELPQVAAQLCNDLSGTSTRYPSPEGSHPTVGWPCPEVELLRRDGSSKRIYELLRESPFVVVDLSGFNILQGLDLEGLPAAALEGHVTRRPAALQGVTAAIVRPDAYIGWATSDPQADVAEIRSQLLKMLHKAA